MSQTISRNFKCRYYARLSEGAARPKLFLSALIALLAILNVYCSNEKQTPENSPQSQVNSQRNRGASNANETPSNDYFARAKQFAKDAQYDSAVVYFEKASVFYQKEDDWSKYVRCYNQMGKYAWQNWELEQAKRYLDIALDTASKKFGENHSVVGETYYLLGLVYTDQNDYNKVFETLNKAVSIQLSTLGEQHLDVAKTYNAIGLYFEKKGEFDRALTNYQKGLEVKRQILAAQDPEIGVSCNNVAIAFWQKGDYEKAFVYSDSAIAIFRGAYGEENPKVGFAYNDRANIYQQKGDYDQALFYYEKAAAIHTSTLGEKSAHTGVDYLNIGLVYLDKGKYSSAIEYCKKALSNFLDTMGEEGDEVAYCYITLGEANSEKGNNHQAMMYYDKALSIYSARYGEQHPTVATIYDSKGSIYQHQRNFKRADIFFNKALSIRLALLGKHHPDVAASYICLGDLSYEIGNYDRAITFYQMAIQADVPSFAADDPHINPPLNGIISEKELLKSLKQKAGALATRYQKRSGDIQDLEASVATYYLVLQLIDQMRSGYKAEGSKLTLAENISDLYAQGIQSALQLYNLTNDEKNKETAFIFAEKSKAGILLEALSEAEAKKFSGIPDTLLEQERQLRIDLAYYDRSLSEERLKREAADSAKISLYENKFFDLKLNYDELLQELEDAFPKYYQLKYQDKTCSIAEIQRSILDGNSTLIEYLVGESSIFIFTIHQNEFEITSVPRDTLLEKEINQLRGSIITSNRTQFTNIASELYNVLIGPIEDKLTTQSLIIVPDGLLCYIPFEVLLTGDVEQDETRDYSALPFLIKKYAVSYAYSATLLLETLNRHRDKTPRDYLAYAPVFAPGAVQGRGDTKDLATNRQPDSLQSVNIAFLPATKAEVLNIKNLFVKRSGFLKRLFGGSSDVYLEGAASEANLKSQKLKKYRYVHFATHGYVNEANPKLSGLILAQNNDTSEDGILYLGEIYNLNFNADLVLLSACETGLGKISRGEGLIGLTRGFLYAGAANLLVSLWQINDNSTAKLMLEFYRQMLDGSGKAQALREAKLALMESDSKYANPTVWAPFILIGK